MNNFEGKQVKVNISDFSIHSEGFINMRLPHIVLLVAVQDFQPLRSARNSPPYGFVAEKITDITTPSESPGALEVTFAECTDLISDSQESQAPTNDSS